MRETSCGVRDWKWTWAVICIAVQRGALPTSTDPCLPPSRRPAQGRREAAEAAQLRQRLAGTQQAVAEAEAAAAAKTAQLQRALVEAKQVQARAEAQIVQLQSLLADAQQVEEARAEMRPQRSLTEAQQEEEEARAVWPQRSLLEAQEEVGAPCSSGRGVSGGMAAGAPCSSGWGVSVGMAVDAPCGSRRDTFSVAQQLMAQMLQQSPVAAVAAAGGAVQQQQQQRHRDRESLDLTQMETPTHGPITAVDFAPEVAAAGGSDLGVDLDVDPSRSMRQQSGPLSLREAPPDSAPPDNDVICVLETLLPQEEMGEMAGWRLPAAGSRGRNLHQGLDSDHAPPAANDQQGPVCIDLSEASPYAPAAARASSQLPEGAAPTFTAAPTACPPASAGEGKPIPQGASGVSRGGSLPLPLQPSLSLGPLGEDSAEIRVNQRQQQRQRQEQPSLLPGEEKEMRGASGRRLPASGSQDGLSPRQQQPSPSVSLGPAEEVKEVADVEEASCDNFASYVSHRKQCEKRRKTTPTPGDGTNDMDLQAAAGPTIADAGTSNTAAGGRAVRQEESEGGQRQRPREKRPHPPPPGDEGRKQHRGDGTTTAAATTRSGAAAEVGAAAGFGTAEQVGGAQRPPPEEKAGRQRLSHPSRGCEGVTTAVSPGDRAGAAAATEAGAPLQPLRVNGGRTGAAADCGRAQKHPAAHQPKQPPQQHLEAPKPSRQIKPLVSGTVVGCWKGFVATPRAAGGTHGAVPQGTAGAGAGTSGGAVAGASGATSFSEAARSGRTLCTSSVAASSAAAATVPVLAHVLARPSTVPAPPVLARPSAAAPAAPTTVLARSSTAAAAFVPAPYKYVEVVRGKAEREALQGVACRQCEQFYAALRSWEEPEGGGGVGGDGATAAAGSRQQQRGREGPSGSRVPSCGHVQQQQHQQQSSSVAARAEGSAAAGDSYGRMGRDARPVGSIT